MADPLGFITAASGAGAGVARTGMPRSGDGAGANFKDVLLQNLNEANAAQQDATRAIEDLATGNRGDVENVVLAAKKAETAFQMLQALRNRVVEAYDEIKQIRV